MHVPVHIPEENFLPIKANSLSVSQQTSTQVHILFYIYTHTHIYVLQEPYVCLLTSAYALSILFNRIYQNQHRKPIAALT